MTLDSNTILRKVLQSRMQVATQSLTLQQPLSSSSSSNQQPQQQQQQQQEQKNEKVNSAIGKPSIHDRLSSTAHSSHAISRGDFRRHRSRSRESNSPPPVAPLNVADPSASSSTSIDRTKDISNPVSNTRSSRSRSRGRSHRDKSRSRSRSFSPRSTRRRSRSRDYHHRHRTSSRSGGGHYRGHGGRDGRSRSRSRSRSRDYQNRQRSRSRESRHSRHSHPPPSHPHYRQQHGRRRDGDGEYDRPSRPSDRGGRSYNRNRRYDDENYVSSETIDTKRPRRPRSPVQDGSKSLGDELARLDHTVRVRDVAPSVRDYELKKFFEAQLIGDVRSAKIVRDHKTGVSKGVGYVEFFEIESVPKALRLTGKVLNGSAIYVDRTDTERSLLIHTMAGSNMGQTAQKETASRKIMVGNIDTKITNEQLLDIFMQFGKIETLDLQKDHTGASRGMAFITYQKQTDSKRALETMHGFSLIGKPLACSYISDRIVNDSMAVETEGGVTTKVSRAELMAKLARNDPIIAGATQVVSKCCLLTNMFNPEEETEENWDEEIKDDVLSECSKFGKVEDIVVDKESKDGRIFLRFDDSESTKKCMEALNGRWFAKKQISAKFISEAEFTTEAAK